MLAPAFLLLRPQCTPPSSSRKSLLLQPYSRFSRTTVTPLILLTSSCQTSLHHTNIRLEPELENAANLPQGDNKEFLELAKIILSGIIDGNNGNLYHIQRPGADHNARWMSKSIYILKMELWNFLDTSSKRFTGKLRKNYKDVPLCFLFLP